MALAIGGNVRYPNLQTIANLFRAKINDTANNTSGSGTGTGNTAGLIMPNTNPDLTTMMDSAIYELFSDLRNVGDPELIIDNYIVTGLPALTEANPTVQVALGYEGYFDGFQWHPQWKLPINLSRLLAVWERETNTNDSFCPMAAAPFGLPGVMQGQSMGSYEMRQTQVWMPGCLTQRDLRIRGRIGYPAPIYSNTLDFNTTYVPILDSTNAIVSKMMIEYAIRFSPDQYQMAIAEEARLMEKLKLEVIRQMQTQENQRAEFGDEAVSDFAVAFSYL